MNVNKQPNVLVIFADQMRGMDIGCAGNKEILTPNMDRLAVQGSRFSHAYANTPVCGPSRGCLLTGRYPLANKVIANDLPLPVDMPTVGSMFKANGYRTGYIGKWHLDGVSRDKWTPPGPRRHGFDYWAVYNCSHDYYRENKYYTDSPEPIAVDGYEPVVQTDIALDFIAKQGEQPFCLFLSWGPPHDPYHLVPDRYKQLYKPQQITLRPNFQTITPGPTSLAQDWDPRQTLADYYAAITALDEQLGRIMDQLDAQGLSDNTILIFTSDHGDMLWSQGKMKKQQPWEESIQIPFLIRWPGHVPSARVNATLLSTVDLAPTLLHLSGIRPSEGMQGTDLSKSVLGQKTDGPQSVFIMDIVTVDESRVQDLPEWRGVRNRRFTYARLRNGTGWLLYDNDEDPYQLVNLVDDPNHKEIRFQLDKVLDGWLQQVGDAFLEGQEHLLQLDLVDLWNEREKALHQPNHETEQK